MPNICSPLSSSIFLILMFCHLLTEQEKMPAPKFVEIQIICSWTDIPGIHPLVNFRPKKGVTIDKGEGKDNRTNSFLKHIQKFLA